MPDHLGQGLRAAHQDTCEVGRDLQVAQRPAVDPQVDHAIDHRPAAVRALLPAGGHDLPDEPDHLLSEVRCLDEAVPVLARGRHGVDRVQNVERLVDRDVEQMAHRRHGDHATELVHEVEAPAGHQLVEPTPDEFPDEGLELAHRSGPHLLGVRLPHLLVDGRAVGEV